MRKNSWGGQELYIAEPKMSLTCVGLADLSLVTDDTATIPPSTHLYVAVGQGTNIDVLSIRRLPSIPRLASFQSY